MTEADKQIVGLLTTISGSSGGGGTPPDGSVTDAKLALTTPALGTPSAIVLTNATGTAASLTAGAASAVAVGGITGLGTGVATALAVAINSSGGFSPINGSATLTNKTIDLGSNTVTMTKAQLNTAVSDDDPAYVGTANTFTAAQTNSKSGAASTSAMIYSGVPFAGTGTTSFPLVYINDVNATASTTLNTAGTYLGVNGDGTQDLMNLLKDGTSKFLVSSAGVVTTGSNILAGGYVSAGNQALGYNIASRGWLSASADAAWRLDNNAQNAFGGLQTLYDRYGSGSPESSVTAPVGAVYHRTDGGANTSLYVKESGSGNTGWVAK